MHILAERLLKFRRILIAFSGYTVFTAHALKKFGGGCCFTVYEKRIGFILHKCI